MEDGTIFFALAFLGAVFGLMYYFFEWRPKHPSEKKQQQHREWEENQKRKQCLTTLIKHRCFDLDSPINIERAKTIANSYLGQISKEELEKLCQEAKEQYHIEIKKEEEKKEKAEKERLSKIREKEIEFYNETTKYAFLYGHEKRKQYYLDMSEEYYEKGRDAGLRRDLAKRAYENANELAGGTNADWSIVGGIASAIGGTGAGIMAASEIQAKNAATEPLKQEIQNYAILTSIQAGSAANEHSAKADEYSRLANSMNAKLLDDKNPTELFKILNPEIVETKLTETGAVKATIKTNAAKIKIFETVDAFIDGTIKGNIMNNGTKVGEILFVLPENGSTYDSTIEGICISLNNPKAKYDLVLETNKLWAIEI